MINRISKSFLAILMVGLLPVSVLLSVSIGESHTSWDNWVELFRGQESLEASILYHIRLPRTLMAIVVGGSLSLCGVILQGIYRNPLVEPYTLGISGGASLGATLTMVLGWTVLGSWTLPFSGFLGALLAIVMVYALSRARGQVDIQWMLLVGVMVSFIASSVVMFLMSIASVKDIPGIVFWTMGALTRPMDALLIAGLLLSFVVLVIAMFLALQLNALSVGDAIARHLGVNTNVVIRVLFLLTSLLTGYCIALAGVIGFVGLVVPHFTRFCVGQDHRWLLPLSYLNGATFLLLCDVVARLLLAPSELPIGVITGIVGGLSFLGIISQRKRTATSF